MDEPLVPGDYSTLVDLKIRSQMDTESSTNQVGVYSRGLPFVVFQVYPEKNGIVWGRISSNTGAGTSRYVGLRVANNMKAKLEKAFEPAHPDDLVSAIRELTAAIKEMKK
jgi:hypothetical protein